MCASRLVACSRLSTTRTPAASASTKPSRSASKGRLAREGSSLRRERARIESKAASPMRVTGASAPPASMTSASPRRMIAAASPSAWPAVAQALATAKFVPFAPVWMAIMPASMSGSIIGTTNGPTRSGPRVCRMIAASTIVLMSPMPLPTMRPTWSASSGVISSSASRIASWAATRPSWRKRSMRRASLRSRYWLGSKPLTSPAMRTSRSSDSKR